VKECRSFHEIPDGRGHSITGNAQFVPMLAPRTTANR
jgi:hypothetical protein